MCKYELYMKLRKKWGKEGREESKEGMIEVKKEDGRKDRIEILLFTFGPKIFSP